MKKETFAYAVLLYLQQVKQEDWRIAETYKFKFANYIFANINFDGQSDDEIYEILVNSQKIKYHKKPGVQFLQRGGKKKGDYLNQKDVDILKRLKTNLFEDVDWSKCSMNYTTLSAWLSSLFPEKIYPIPVAGFYNVIDYLFDIDIETFPKQGKSLITNMQGFMRVIDIELKLYPFEQIFMPQINHFFSQHPELKVAQKTSFLQVDWNWLVEDFFLFIHRNILKLYKNPSDVLQQDVLVSGFEGNTKTATHIIYERNSNIIKKIKQIELDEYGKLTCEACNFSFSQRYSKLGHGYIEAHHLQPLYEAVKRKTTRRDIALLCSNCHRMIHRLMSDYNIEPQNSLQNLKKILDVSNE